MIMLSGVVVGCEEHRRGQIETWCKSMKTLTIRFSHVNKCRLLDCDLRDYRNQCLETLSKMARNRLQ